MDNYIINKICPVCHNNKVELSELGTEICTQCRYVLPGPTYATNSTSSAEKYCPNCNTKMEPFGDKWLTCPNCHYGYMDYIGDLPRDINELYIKSDGVGTAYGRFDPDLIPHILQIDTELIKLRHKEMELEFKLEPDKLANIDTIIINGHKFVREKSE